MDDVLCSIVGCKKGVYARGYCKSHYSKLRNEGELVKLPPREPKFCSIAGCEEKFSAKGLCVKHYREFKVKNNYVLYKNMEIKRQEKARRIKWEIVVTKGGKCVLCGYDKNLACLEFHHINPLKKQYTPKSIIRRGNLLLAREELEKCMLVCKNCHADIHHPVIPINLEQEKLWGQPDP